jgi:phosphate transport system protein
MMERHFDEELKNLKTDILKMAALTEEAIHKSIEALKTRDKNLAQKVIDQDRRIDELEIAVEEKAIDLLALRQPMAVDLRFITTGMKINEEIERIADLTVNICQRVLEVANYPLLKPLVDIPKLSNLAENMTKNAIDAFVNRDEALARKVMLSEPEADRLRNLIYEELIDEHIVKDGACAPRAIPLLLVARHLERICDHATYVAVDVIYMIQAKVLKHRTEKPKNNVGKGQK